MNVMKSIGVGGVAALVIGAVVPVLLPFILKGLHLLFWILLYVGHGFDINDVFGSANSNLIDLVESLGGLGIMATSLALLLDLPGYLADKVLWWLGLLGGVVIGITDYIESLSIADTN